MAGNYLAVTARFNPLSYEEIISPLAQATQAQQDIESQYSQLGQASDIWTNALDKTVNPIAAQRVEDYKSQLQQAAQELSTKGLTPQSRQSLAQMKNQYASDIAPIEQAYTKGQELSKELRLQREQNPTLLTNITPQTLSVDYLMQHPDVTPEYYSGALLTNQVASAVKAYANQVRQEGRMRNIAGGQYLERIDKYGLDPADVQAAMQGRGPKFLQDIVQNVIATSPISKWENAQNILPQAYQYAASGLSAGIGEDKIFREANRGFETEGERLSNKIKRLQLQALLTPKQDTNLYYQPVAKGTAVQGRSTTDIQKDIALIHAMRKNLKGTLGKVATVPDQIQIRSIRSGYTAPRPTYYPNQQRWDALVKRYGRIGPQAMLDKMNAEIQQSAVRNNVYKMRIADPTLIVQQIKQNALIGATEGKTLITYMKDGKPTNKQVPADDIDKLVHHNASLLYDPDYGYSLNAFTSGGKAVQLHLDPEAIELYDRYGRGVFAGAKQHLEKSLQRGDIAGPQGYNSTLNALFKTMYKNYNTLLMRQGETTSKPIE